VDKGCETMSAVPIMTQEEKVAYIEKRHDCMAQYSFKELIAELRGNKKEMIRWDTEHKRCAKEVLEVLML